MASPALADGVASGAAGVNRSTTIDGDDGARRAAAQARDDAVRAHLARILASPAFRNSKRYSAVLTYIVEQKLAGNEERLKERTIGVDVFGREPDYDTASDHAVRSAMAEVRKRLAQYYRDTTPTNEVRFELQPGSYVPQFCPPDAPERSAPAGAESPPHRDAPEGPDHAVRPRRPRWIFRGSVIAGLCALCAVAALMLRAGGRNDRLADFWGPVLASKMPVLLCLGNAQGGAAPGEYRSPVDLSTLSMGDFHRLPSQTVHLMDAAALARLSGFLQSRGKPWWVATQSDVSFADLRKGPVVLIGLMNNDWTERIVGKLRFRAEKIAPRTIAIRDAMHPENNRWSMSYSTPLLKITQDYALVLRIFDPSTGEPVITAAGISVFGTQAAAEFLTDGRDLAALDGLAPGWKRKNLEIVLSTEVVRARSGAPRVIAVRAW